MVRVLSLICAAVTLLSSTVVAKKADVVTQYTVSCKKTYIVKNGDTVSLYLINRYIILIIHDSVVKSIKPLVSHSIN